jgi:uncharacterized protein YjbI with pentapeptide repeats
MFHTSSCREESRVDQQQQSRWQPTTRQVLWTLGIVAVVVILIGYRYGITLWDWLEILVVPAAIALGVFWLNARQSYREREIEEQRQNNQREVEEQRAQNAALQQYLDQVTQLLLDKKDSRLLKMELNEDVRAVILARTEAIRRSLDARNRRSLVDFLQALGLLNKLDPVVSLAGYDLRGVDWRRANLQEADLRRMDLRFVNLESANLEGADLEEADLEEANLKGANLRFANLWDAFLAGADFEGADLREAKLNRASLSTASLIKANLTKAELSEAHLMTTNLHKTILRRALLIGADLTEADLTEADLTEAILAKADLTSADLTGAILEGATMPNGQKYEDWLKDKKAQGKDEKNE